MTATDNLFPVRATAHGRPFKRTHVPNNNPTLNNFAFKLILHYIISLLKNSTIVYHFKEA